MVVNHLSDSVSVVDVAASPPQSGADTARRRRTAGHRLSPAPGETRLPSLAAHRGQNPSPIRSYRRRAIGRADVWDVSTPPAPGDVLGGTPPTVLALFADSPAPPPEALAVSGDGSVVYAAALQSGNQTVTVSEGAVCDGGQEASCEVDGVAMPGGLPAPKRERGRRAATRGGD
jgi:hypothetical protein